MADKAPVADPAPSLYTVAKGRSFVTDEGPKGPGETVALSDDEAARFRALGFILGEDGTALVANVGPAVNVENGVTVKTV